MLARLMYLSFLIIGLDLASSGSMIPLMMGGYPANEVSAPYIVSVELNGIHLCGGSIINEQTILTAAHCVGEDPSLFQVVAGSKLRSSSRAQRVSISAIHIHSNFSPDTIDCDIALLRLSRKIEFGPYIQPIRLISAGEGIPDGTDAQACGWGITSVISSILPDMLRCASVPVINHDLCGRLYGNIITDHMLCAGKLEGGVDTCRSDSGGPLVVDQVQFGIVSFGIGCALPNKPGVYASVSALRPWVDEILAKEYNERLSA